MSNRAITRAAILAFLSSRAFIFAGLIVLSQVSFLEKVDSNSVWKTSITLRAERVRPELTRMMMIADGWWYRRIAERGYTNATTPEEISKRAFFPLYPLLVRSCRVTGDFAVDGVIVSNVAFLLALFVVGQLARRCGLDDEDAERAIYYLAFFPTSYFFSLPMTESLFLLLSSLAFLAARSDKWWAAGVAGALASATRVTGILLLPVLLILAWQRYKRITPQLLWLALIPCGLGAFMLHLHQRTGDALAFIHVQQEWGRHPGPFWQPLINYAMHWPTVGEPWNLLTFNFLVAVLLLTCAVALFLRRDFALATYTLLATLLPLTSGSLQSLARYAVVVFPLFFWLAIQGRRPRVDRLMLIAMVVLFGWFLALFALRLDFTMA